MEKKKKFCFKRLAAVALVIEPFALVPAAILPDIASNPMHDSILERSVEVAAICPLEAAIATHFVV